MQLPAGDYSLKVKQVYGDTLIWSFEAGEGETVLNDNCLMTADEEDLTNANSEKPGDWCD